MSDFDISGVLRIDTTDLDASLGRVGSTAKRIAGALAAVFAIDKIVDWGKAGLKAAGDYEQSEIAFTSLLGSAEKAHGFMAELREFVLKTPFEFPGLADASRKLLGYGFSAKSVIPIMTDIGDAASALGVSEAGINGFVRALGQMQGKGKVSADEIRQISENMPGFNAAATIAASKGISVAETYKLMEQGAIPAADGIDAILNGLKNFPGAAGAMERQNKTLLGSFNALKESIRFAAVDIFKPLLPAITAAIRAFAEVLRKNISPTLVDAANNLARFGQVVSMIVTGDFSQLPKLLEGLKPNDKFAAFLRAFADAGQRIRAELLPPLRELRDGVSAIFDQNMGEVPGFVQSFVTGFSDVQATFNDPGMTGAIAQFGQAVREVFDAIGGAFKLFITGFKNPEYFSGVNAIEAPFAQMGANIRNTLDGIQARVREFMAGFRGELVVGEETPFYHIGEAAKQLNIAILRAGPPVAAFFTDQLLPAIGAVGAFVTNHLVPIFGGISGALAAFGVLTVVIPTIVKIVAAFSSLAAFGGALASLFPAIATAIGFISGPIGIAVVAIGALVAGFIWAYREFQGFRDVIGVVLDFVMEKFGELKAFGDEIWPQVQEAATHTFNVIMAVVRFVVEAATKLWELLGDDILRVGKGLFTIVSGLVGAVIGIIANVVRFVLAIINGDWGKAWQAFQDIFTEACDGIVEIFKGLWDVLAGVIGAAYDTAIKRPVMDLVNSIVDLFKSLFGIASPSKVFLDLGANIIQGLIDGIIGLGSALIDAVLGIGAFLFDNGKKAFMRLVDASVELLPQLLLFFIELPGRILNTLGEIGGVLHQKGKDLLIGLAIGIYEKFVEVRAFFAELPGRVRDGLGILTGILKQKGLDIIEGLRNGIIERVAVVKKFVSEIPGNVVAGFGIMTGLLKRAGLDIIEGLLAGIREKAAGIAEFIKTNVTDKIPKAVRDHLGIASPSKVMAAIGLEIPNGLALGIKRGTSAVEKAMNGLMDATAFNLADAGNLNVSAGSMTIAAMTPPVAVADAGGSNAPITVNLYANDPEAARSLLPDLTRAIRAGVGGK